jgi:hypothetical protein
MAGNCSRQNRHQFSANRDAIEPCFSYATITAQAALKPQIQSRSESVQK